MADPSRSPPLCARRPPPDPFRPASGPLRTPPDPKRFARLFQTPPRPAPPPPSAFPRQRTLSFTPQLASDGTWAPVEIHLLSIMSLSHSPSHPCVRLFSKRLHFGKFLGACAAERVRFICSCCFRLCIKSEVMLSFSINR